MRIRAGLLATMRRAILAAGLTASGQANAEEFPNISDMQMMQWVPCSQPTARLRYADESPLQFGDLRVPSSPPPAEGYPVIMFIHGGGWLSDWNKDYSDAFVENLSRSGYATWSIEYRRLGNIGGGYPGTYLDIARSAEYLATLAQSYPLNLKKMVVVGHSAGGHLASWLTGRQNIPKESPLSSEAPIRFQGVVAISSVSSLEDVLEKTGRETALPMLGAKNLEEARLRYGEASPDRLLPMHSKIRVIDGSKDADWRIASNTSFAQNARSNGEDVERIILNGANHFDVMAPTGPGFAEISRAISEIIPTSEGLADATCNRGIVE